MTIKKLKKEIESLLKEILIIQEALEKNGAKGSIGWNRGDASKDILEWVLEKIKE